MSTYGEESESELARLALAALGERRGARVLVGGLGVGYTLREALRQEWVGHVTVIEIEPVVEVWARTYFRSFNGGALSDPRTTAITDDIGPYIRSTHKRYDAIVLDVDNGPDEAVLAQNASLYDEAGLGVWARRLTNGGVLAIWSARRVPGFDERLRRVFSRADIHEIPASVRTSAADYVYVAKREP